MYYNTYYCFQIKRTRDIQYSLELLKSNNEIPRWAYKNKLHDETFCLRCSQNRIYIKKWEKTIFCTWIVWWSSRDDKGSAVHKKTNSEWNLFICHICDEVFPTSSGKLRHMRSHAEIKTFPITCEVCNKQFSRSDNLKRHMRTHYIHQCDICGVRCIDNMARLYNHMKTHSAEQAFNLNVWDCFLTEKKWN